MASNKLERFAELKTMPNVFEDATYQPSIMNLSSDWYQKWFNNNNPIILELACGKGEYTVELAQKYPDINFIGVDIKGNRIWKGAKLALDENLKNVAFLRTYIDKIDSYFPPESISEIWITFPDPFLKKSKSNKRLTSELFLNRYKKILKKGGIIHLKTDSPQLYEFTVGTINSDKYETIHNVDDIYQKGFPDERLAIKTYYEKMHLEDGRIIRYVAFRFR